MHLAHRRHVGILFQPYFIRVQHPQQMLLYRGGRGGEAAGSGGVQEDMRERRSLVGRDPLREGEDDAARKGSDNKADNITAHHQARLLSTPAIAIQIRVQARRQGVGVGNSPQLHHKELGAVEAQGKKGKQLRRGGGGLFIYI